MTTSTLKYDPIVSEFESETQERSYNRWFADKVQRSMNDTSPNYSHDEALAFMQQELAKRKAQRQC